MFNIKSASPFWIMVTVLLTLNVYQWCTASTKDETPPVVALDPLISEEWQHFEQFLSSRDEFSQYDNVSIRQLSAWPSDEHTKVCMALRYTTGNTDNEGDMICFRFLDENRFHFALSPLANEPDSLMYMGVSYNGKSIDDQLHALFDIYGHGLVQLAMASDQ